MKMKAFCFFIMMVVCSTLFSLGHAARLTQKFVDDQYHYSIRYPSSWSAVTYRSGDVVANLKNGDSSSGLQVRYLKSSSGSSAFVDHYIAQFKKDMGATVLSDVQLDFAVGRISAISFRGGRGNKDFFLKSYIFFYPNTKIILQAGAPYSERDRVEPILDAMAQSLRLNKL